MKTFFKNIFTSCLGSLVAITAIFSIFLLLIFIYSQKNNTPNEGILHIPLDGTVSEYSQVSFNIDNFSLNPSGYTLWDFRNKLSAAAEDKNIRGIYLELKSAEVSHQMAEELIYYLKEFKKSGKRIFAYADYYDQNSYMIATVADSIFLNPNGGVDLKGYAIFSPFFKAILDKYDIDINIYYAGKYKAATEPYRLEEFSEDNRYQLKEYLNNLHDNLIDNISVNRELSPGKVAEIVSKANSYDARYMLDEGIVDGIKYKDEIHGLLDNEWETDELINFHQYRIKQPHSRNASTAIVFAEGQIIWGKGGPGTISNDDYAEIFKTIRNDKKIDKVIIRFNSPGGNGFASDNLHREITLLKQEGKKVYASFGSMAASGAYYMAAACDTILAAKTTLTGSIGVYLMLPTFERFINEELGITFDSVGSAAHSLSYTPFLSISDDEKNKLISQTDKLYDQFLVRVSNGRDISIDSVQQLAQGRLWTGEDAKEKGLVDGTKLFEEALKEVIDEKDLKVNHFKVFPEQKFSFADALMKNNLGNVKFFEKLDFAQKLIKSIDFQDVMKSPTPKMSLPFQMFVRK